MAYTNAIFRVDYVNGSNSARTTLSGVVFSKSGTDDVLGTYISHGLVTGAVIDVTGCTQAYANSAWKITWVSADTFTLDGASWLSFTGADVTGDAVPRGGSSWSDAWKTCDSSGASSARIQAGDTIRIAKSPAPYSIGNADWTQNSKTVTLADARTYTVDNCESGWTAANSAVCTLTAVATDAKQGSYCQKVTFPNPATISTLYAYYNISDIAGSIANSYQSLSFWMKHQSAALSDTFRVCLCSNDDGTGVVDEFIVPDVLSAARWIPFNLARSGGGNLGGTVSTTIKSVALYTGTNITVPSNKYIYIDNIIMTKTDDLNLTSLISKNNSEQGGVEGWYPIQSIDGTTILIDNSTDTKSNSGKGYSGSTETGKASYARECVKLDTLPLQASTLQKTTKKGTRTSWINYIGGYNTTNDNCDGETFWSGQNGFGYGFQFASSLEFNSIQHINCVRFDTGIRVTTPIWSKVSQVQSCTGNSSHGIYNDACDFFILEDIGCLDNNGTNGLFIDNSTVHTGTINSVSGNLTNGVRCTGPAKLNKILRSNNNNGSGVYCFGGYLLEINEVTDCSYNAGRAFESGTSPIIVKSSSTSNNASNGFFAGTNALNYMYNWSCSDSTEIQWQSSPLGGYVFSGKHDGNINNDILFTYYGNISKQSSVKEAGTSYSLQASPTSSNCRYLFPLDMPFNHGFKFAVAASKLVTFTVRMRKDHATDIIGGIKLQTPQLGVSSSDPVLMSDTADTWETVTLQFTPSEAGIAEITPFAYYSDSATTFNKSVYFGTVTVSQAS